MTVIFAVALAIAVVMLCIASKAFRYVTLGGVVLTVGGVYLLMKQSDARSEAMRAAYFAKKEREDNLIPARLMENNMSAVNISLSYGVARSVSAVIKNPSNTATITSIVMTIWALDCHNGTRELKDCDTVGEDKERSISVEIPPGQMRKKRDRDIKLENMAPGTGPLLWTWQVDRVFSSEADK